MKKSSLAAIAIPEQAKIMRETSTDVNYSRAYDTHTGTVVKWTSATIATGYPAVIMSFIDGGPWAALSLGFGIASGLAGFFTLGAMFIEGSAQIMKRKLIALSQPVEPGKWKSQKDKPTNNYSGEAYHGIKVFQRSRRSLFSAYLNPMRPFRKILLAETIWYEPAGDYFTRECHYMGMFNWVETTQLYSGRRRTFVNTLTSLEDKPQNSLPEKVKAKS